MNKYEMMSKAEQALREADDYAKQPLSDSLDKARLAVMRADGWLRLIEAIKDDLS